MKNIKRLTAIILCLITVASLFAGCKKSETLATEVTDETMLVAYTDEAEPFIYTENGKLTGFDVEVFKSIFDKIKNDYKDMYFVKVDKGYRLGEDVAYTAEDGTEYKAYILIGGVQQNDGTVNEHYSFTNPVIENRVITVTNGGKVKSYISFEGANVGVISDAAVNALDRNTALKNSCGSVKLYTNISKAINELKQGKIDALVTDEFTYNTAKAPDSFIVLDGELDTVTYAYAFKKWDWYRDTVNEALNEMQNPEYGGTDDLTPLVEKYFGYDACNFEYSAVNE